MQEDALIRLAESYKTGETETIFFHMTHGRISPQHLSP
jgi:hypothetical protein